MVFIYVVIYFDIFEIFYFMRTMNTARNTIILHA